MSLRAVVEVALHFESFRNIDLFHQGLYHLKTRLYREDGDARITAVPCGHMACSPLVEQPKPKASRTDHHHLIPAHVIEDQCTFSTRSFLIRYCEEELELNDIGQFRIELSMEECESTVPLLLEVDLMFADLTQHGGADRFGDHPDVDSTEFKSVSTQTFKVHGVHRGLHEFCPVIFDEFHFCLANLVLHSTLIDYRLRLRPPPPAPSRTKPGGGKAGIGEDGAGASGRKSVGGEGNDAGNAGRPAVPTSQNAPLSLAECLFADCPGEGREALLQHAEGLYGRHVDVLVSAYSKLADWFKQVCNSCLTPAQFELFRDEIEVPQLQSPYAQAPAKSPASSDDSLSTACTDGYFANGHGALLRRLLEAKLSPAVTERSIASQFAYDANIASCRIIETWHKVLNIMLHANREVTSLLRVTWEKEVAGQWSATILKDSVSGCITMSESKAVAELHSRLSDELRRSVGDRQTQTSLVEDSMLMPSTDQRPVLFEQRYNHKNGAATDSQPERGFCVPSAPKNYRGVHLFVLVHGFQGNSFDMRLMKNNIALLYPDAVFLCSTSNEDNTEGDINEMGIRLAQEVVNYICDWCQGSALGRLSFIAHSMGGLIARAALPLLHEYSSKMFTFLTLSSSHLGIFQDKLSLFNTGFWVLKQWRKSSFLQQVSMTDHPDPKQTFLYKLSKAKGFEFFQNIVLVSCCDDQYGPFQSARAEMCSLWENQTDKEVYREMVKNIWQPVRPERVTRFDVNFLIPEKNLDTFIGRAAHIQFLENQSVMKMIIHNYSFLFR